MVSDKCFKMWHKNYPLHLMYYALYPVKLVRENYDKNM